VWDNSLILCLVLSEPVQTGNDVHLSVTGDFTLHGNTRLCPWACPKCPVFCFDSWTKSEQGCGRVGVLLPSISVLRQLCILCTFSHAWWVKVLERDRKWLSQDLIDTLSCLRSARGGVLLRVITLGQDPSHFSLGGSSWFARWVCWICLARLYDPLQSDSQVSQVMKRVPARCPPPCTPLSLQEPDKIPLLTYINQLDCLIWFWLHLNSHPCQTSLSERSPWNEKHVFKKLDHIFLLGTLFEKTTVLNGRGPC